MPGLGNGFDPQGERAFFSDADHGDRAFDAGNDSLGDRAAFVQHSFETVAAFSQVGCNLFGALLAANFFILTKAEENGAFRPEILFEQQFSRFQQPDHLAFDVKRTASPDIVVGDDTGKGRMFPLVERAGVNRHHIQMGAEQHRRQFKIGAAPGVEQRRVRNDLALQRGMHARILAFEYPAQLTKGRKVGRRAFEVGDGFAANGFGQMVGDKIGVHFRQFDRRNRLAWTQKRAGTDQDYGD